MAERLGFPSDDDEFKRQAWHLLRAYELLDHGATVHGSYYLDLMVCPDIDAYTPAEACTDIFALARALYENSLTNDIYVMKGSMVGVPEAQHIQVRTNVETRRAKWKIDIWVFPSSTIQANMNEMNRLKGLLTVDSRSAILELKRALLQTNGFSPKYSGFHVCKAYLDHGITSLGEIKEYLRKQGIQFV